MWTGPPGPLTLMPLLWPINRISCIFQDQWKVIEETSEMKLCSHTFSSPSRGSGWTGRKQTDTHDVMGWVLVGDVAERASQGMRKQSGQKCPKRQFPLMCVSSNAAARFQHRREAEESSARRSEWKRTAGLFSHVKAWAKARQLLSVCSTETPTEEG